MNIQEESAAAFLRRHGMYYQDFDMAASLYDLMDAMEEDYQKHGSAGRMIPAYIGAFHAPVTKRRVTVMDIGGTNVRCAVMELDHNGLAGIDHLQSFLTPGVEAPVDTNEFFTRIAQRVRDNLTSDEIGICFSLATIPQKDKDAVMVAGGKQIQITDMLGKKVGESFRHALAGIGHAAGQRITVINDTVAAALGGQLPGGIHTGTGLTYGGYIGFIYGTGMNLCYREPTGELINTEAGAYCVIPSGDLDDAYDRTLIDTGKDRLEKMISGGYQGGLMRCILLAAAREGVISAKMGERLPPVFTSKDISAFSNEPYGENSIARVCTNDRDRLVTAAICDAVTERSACICTVAITAALLRAGIGKDKYRPAFITAEGSTYLKQKGFREKLENQMAEFAGKCFGLHYEFHDVPDVILRGIGAACLSD